MENGDHIEPAGRITRVGQQIISRRAAYTSLFGSGDGLGGCGIAAMPAAAYFHKDQALTVTHNQIHLTGAAAIIALDQDKTCALNTYQLRAATSGEESKKRENPGIPGSR